MFSLRIGGGRFESLELAVAVHQRQRVDGRGVAVMVVVGELQFFARFVFAAQAHQVDAQLRMRAPEIGRGGDGLADSTGCLFIAAVDHEEMRDGFVALAAIADLRHPGRFLVGQQIDRGLDGDRFERIGLNRQRGIGFARAFFVVVVFQRDPRHQFVRLIELRIGFERLCREFVGLGVVLVGQNPRHRPAAPAHSSDRSPALPRRASALRRD